RPGLAGAGSGGAGRAGRPFSRGLPNGQAFPIIPLLLLRGGAVWQLVGLITRRSQVQILPPLPDFSRPVARKGWPAGEVGLCRGRLAAAPVPKSSVTGQGARRAPCSFPWFDFPGEGKHK